jgi:hypothetical protein
MTIEEQAQPAKRRRNRTAVQPIRLQERDLDMLLSISVGRYLSVPAIEWLHYPAWRERYRAFLEQQKTDPAATFYPTPKLYTRLRALRDGSSPLVQRLMRSVERASVVFNRLPDAYVLTEAGAELLCTRRGYELDQLWYEDPRKRSIKNFEHSVAIGTFYAALRSTLEFFGQELTDWRGDHLLASRDPQGQGPGYDRVRASWVGKGGRLKETELPVLPDGTFTLAGTRYFVEIDRGTTNLESWGEKIHAYEAYRRSAKLRARYATDAFTVLIVAPTETRMKRIAEEIIKITEHPSPAYLFTTEDRVHPTRIRPGWKELASVEWTHRKVVDRLVELPSQLRFTPHPLWKNPEQPA